VNVTAQESPRTRSVVAPTWKLRAQRQRRTWVLWTALMVVLALALAADFRFFHVFLGRSEPEPVPPVLPEPAAVEPAPPGRREAAAESVAPVPAPLPKCTPASPEEQKQVLPGSAALPKCAPVPAQPALPVKAAEAAGEAKGGAGQAGTGTGTGEKDVQDAAPGADEEQATSTKLSVLPPDAVIFVDGRHLGTQPQYVEVAPHRTRKVRIEAEGFAAVEFELSHPGPDKLARKLEKLATGKLWFRYVPASARVFVDGKQVEGKNGLNIVEMELPVGEHHILVSDGARERSETAFIEQGKIWKRTIEIAP
jgi:hypothetical protein